jgi:hypothetical protein
MSESGTEAAVGLEVFEDETSLAAVEDESSCAPVALADASPSGKAAAAILSSAFFALAATALGLLPPAVAAATAASEKYRAFTTSQWRLTY